MRSHKSLVWTCRVRGRSPGPVFRNDPRALAGLTPKTREPRAIAIAFAVRVLKHPRAPVPRVMVSPGPPRFVDCHLLKVRIGEIGRSVPVQVSGGSIVSAIGHGRILRRPKQKLGRVGERSGVTPEQV